MIENSINSLLYARETRLHNKKQQLQQQSASRMRYRSNRKSAVSALRSSSKLNTWTFIALHFTIANTSRTT